MRSGLLLICLSFAFLPGCAEKKEQEALTMWMQKGDSLVSTTFDSLRNTLLRTIAEQGFPGAIQFCNTMALPLTAAYTNAETSIRRATDKYRNPANNADSMEQRLLTYFQQQRKEQKEMTAVVETDKQGRKHFFKPIIMQRMCLNCHGNKDENISTATWDAIRKLYPGDRAINYREGDLRGLWHIVFRP